ncbi:MAG: hypothetical protein L3J33_07725 [Rhodobacteraceae bacterium]|nr:hypothetical protein [Paracoccaceae bacterium]
MKKSLVAAAAVMSLSGAASAQVAFQFGTIDLDYYNADFPADIYMFGGSARADYDIGNFGLQLDGNIVVMTDFSSNFTSSSVGAHVYKELGNGTKLGAYLGAEIISFLGSTSTLFSYGLEGMTSLGPVDVEAYLGGLSFEGSNIFWTADVDAYYSVTEALEISAGITHMFDDGFSDTGYSIGVKYDIPNMPISIGAEYTFNEFDDMVILKASYAFGGPTDERLFSERQSNFLVFGGP